MGLWTPTLLPGLAGWWDGEDSTFSGTQWNDLSGNALHLTTGGTQPTRVTSNLNSKAIIRFGAGARLAVTPGSPFASLHYIAVVKRTASSSFEAIPLTGTNGGSAAPVDGWSVHRYGNGTNVDGYTDPASLTAWSMLGLEWSQNVTPAHVSEWLNATSVKSADMHGSFTTTSQVITVMSRGDGATHLTGDLAMIVATSTLPTTSDRQKLEGYAAWRFGLQANLPGGHPYASSAPTDGTTNGTGSGASTSSGSATGTPKVLGTAAGSSTSSASATGTPKVLGTAAGSSASSGAATGVPRVLGVATGSSASSGVATGLAKKLGTGVGASTSAGTATGVRTTSSSGVGSSTSAGAAVGTPVVKGSGSGASTSSGVATGTHVVLGSASGASSSSAAATGIPHVFGIGSGASTSSGIAAGGDIRVGTGVGSSTSSGSASGTVIHHGTASGASTSAGSGLGLVLVLGVLLGSSTSAGTATGHGHTPGPAGPGFPYERTYVLNALRAYTLLTTGTYRSDARRTYQDT